jgi:hypothetical protein
MSLYAGPLAQRLPLTGTVVGGFGQQPSAPITTQSASGGLAPPISTDNTPQQQSVTPNQRVSDDFTAMNPMSLGIGPSAGFPTQRRANNDGTGAPGVNPNGSIVGAVGPTSVGGMPLVNGPDAPMNIQSPAQMAGVSDGAGNSGSPTGLGGFLGGNFPGLMSLLSGGDNNGNGLFGPSQITGPMLIQKMLQYLHGNGFNNGAGGA